MSIDRILQLKLVTDVGDINSKMSSVTAQTSKVGAAFNTLTSFAGPVAINAALTGMSMLVDGLKGGVEDAKKFNDAVTGLTGTLAPLGIAAGAAAELAENAAAVGASLGFADDDQVVRGLQAFAEQTQSAAEAQALLGAAMDLSRLHGIGLEEAVTKVQAIYKGSSRTLAEFGVSGVVGMAAVTAALGDNTTAAETWATTSEGQYAVVAASIDDAFQTAGSAINDAINGVILPAFATLLPVIGELWATWQPILAELGTKFGEIIGKMLEVWNKLQPAFQAFGDFIAPLIDNIVLYVGILVDMVTGALDTIIALLNGDFTGAFAAIQATVDSVTTKVMEAIGNLVGFFAGIAETVGNVAKGVGDAIFNGIASGVNLVVGVVRSVINKVIGALNSINEFTWERQGFEVNTVFGNAFVGVGAGSIQMWPDIPLLAKGGIVNGPTLAMIGEAGPEAVVPLGQGGGFGSTYNIVVNVAPGGDLVETGKRIVQAITQYERRSGKVWRSS